MLLDAAWHLFEQDLFPAASTESLFNPYRDRHEAFDLPDAPTIRRGNLRRYLGAYTKRPPVFLLAEAPGPWGCRFSGVPLVSEAQLVEEGFPVSGHRSSTAEAPHAEYSSKIYWRVLRPYFPHFFTWNSVPYHPHRPGEPLSIRNPTNREVAAYGDVLAALLEILRPARILAVGRKAEHALRKIGAEGAYVRHPSQGGARLFEAGVRAAMEEVLS